MEPEDQSRNSRPRPDPVTIDLGAEEVKEMPAADSDGAEDNVTAEPADETASSESPSPESSSRSYSGIPDASTSTAASEARETARLRGATAALPPARATPPRPEATPAAPDCPTDPRL